MTQPPYRRAPITEVVIEIRFTTPVGSGDFDRASEKFASFYPQHQRVQIVKVAVELPPPKKGTPKAQIDRQEGNRRSSEDMTHLLVLWPSAFVVSQLAPYPGWEELFKRFVRDWKIWKRVMGFRPISRIGVRYINRIDIPITGKIVEHESFLNVYPHLPNSATLGPMSAYAVQAEWPIADIGCKVTLNTAAVPSPILDHASFVVDQDISRDVDPPQKDGAIYKLLGEIRLKKNALFEACITDRTRELFQ